ncbi:hypothetical protein BGP_3707 [Beggiatoa sp. PS]|nr:hypothetical protein BGP_3707 [Beggiatoa sp. PS]
MIFVVSDTNIPSSLAAGNALSSLSLLLSDTTIYIPPTVYQELQIGLERGKTHLNLVFEMKNQCRGPDSKVFLFPSTLKSMSQIRDIERLEYK